MKNIKYYCVKLNGYNKKRSYYGVNGENTFLDRVLKKEYKFMDKETLEEDLLELDDEIEILSETTSFYASFPIILKEENGKLYDVITNIEVPNSLDENHFGYIEKNELSNLWANFLLSSLEEESKLRYKEELESLINSYNLKHEEFTSLKDNSYLSLVLINDKIYEKLTKNRVYLNKNNTIYYDITIDNVLPKKDIKLDKEYLDNMNKLYSTSVKNYNMFVSLNSNSLDLHKINRIRK